MNVPGIWSQVQNQLLLQGQSRRVVQPSYFTFEAGRQAAAYT